MTSTPVPLAEQIQAVRKHVRRMENASARWPFEYEIAAHKAVLATLQQHERAMAALRKSRQALELIVSIQGTAKISRTNENAAFVDWRDLAAASGDAQEALAALDGAANTTG